ncbi:hypothetical protein MIND_00008700 [Mycena indigotica]|uniref:GDP-fucose protein O-fucosyltransferase 2 n=1 Tax=Mycena indigotica TaxID=2126181 RepID=A0A8H6TDV8_9AGAR|nr:uncharacterized protein MIND_00008700 [Mycena indigotica]KAF7314947.1 hypothetical protein MIND_00008700 [Mycena indigotica]
MRSLANYGFLTRRPPTLAIVLVCGSLLAFRLFPFADTALESPPSIPVLTTTHTPERFLLNGPPTRRLKDNLRADLKYITTWHGNGFTNDIMSYINLLYLAKATQRVAIMDSFFPAPQHVGKTFAAAAVTPTNLPFKDVFDLPRFTELSGVQVVQWADVKNASSDEAELDSLGCWNLDQANVNNKGPHVKKTPEQLKIDISYSIAPYWVKQYPEQPGNEHVRLSQLVALSFPRTYRKSIQSQKPVKSSILQLEVTPDDHLMCFDYLFTTCENSAHDIWMDYSSTWRQIGQYLHFHPKIERLAQEYLRKILDVAVGEDIPPYIAVHVRHGDFEDWCNGLSREDCFAPLSTYRHRVQQLQARLLEEKGVSVEHVVMTSDEVSEEWWAEVASYGWARPDHTTTKDEHGPWYTVLIDNAIQGLGHGVVGTKFSTVSSIAAKRVESWNNGLSYMVKWGIVGADNMVMEDDE